MYLAQQAVCKMTFFIPRSSTAGLMTVMYTYQLLHPAEELNFLIWRRQRLEETGQFTAVWSESILFPSQA